MILYTQQEDSLVFNAMGWGVAILFLVLGLILIFYFLSNLFRVVMEFKDIMAGIKESFAKEIHQINLSLGRLSQSLENATQAANMIGRELEEYKVRHEKTHETEKTLLHQNIKEVMNTQKQQGKRIDAIEDSLKHIESIQRTHDDSIFSLGLKAGLSMPKAMPAVVKIKNN